MTVLEKIRCLEKYISINNSVVDSVIEATINKLLAREHQRISEIKIRLKNDIAAFENQYNIKSETFYHQYAAGDLGDETDFIEWAATIEMLASIKQQSTLLLEAVADQ